MIPWLSIDALLLVHVSMSLIAIATGLVAMAALAFGRFLPGWQAIFSPRRRGQHHRLPLSVQRHYARLRLRRGVAGRAWDRLPRPSAPIN